ncbi:MAG: helix-turn-helix domain containing protein [Lachnospiraceae bacterium]|nr:helix-turn-helix domain containing protein [Lachnospiraceae bacterium]
MPARKQITKDMIIKAALKILREKGYEAVNIKELACELNCSTQPVYLSFAGMDELRGELAPAAVDFFEKYMKQDSEDNTVRLYGMEYIRFAKNEPRLFWYLFMRAHSFAEIKTLLHPIIEKSIAELMTEYNISHEEADLLHDRMWMQAHGIAAMTATDFCDWDMDKAARMLDKSCRDFTAEYKR